MKKTQMVSAGIAFVLAITFISHAQTAIGTVQSISVAPVDSVVQIAAESQGLSPLLPEEVPLCGTFWTVFPDSGGAPVPMPCPPLDPSMPIFTIADGQFLVDATGVALPQPTGRQVLRSVSSATLVQEQMNMVLDFIAQVQETQANAELGAIALDAPMPGDGGDEGGTSSYTANFGYTPIDYGTNLWIRLDGILSGNLVGILSNTVSGVYFDLLIKSNLLQSDWMASGWGAYGADITNWTPFSLPMSSPSNLFVRARSWTDSTGSGIPDWWWLQYFGSVGGDPFAFDFSGDGLTFWQDFVGGLNPTVFNTPPAPRGLTVSYNANNGNALVSWQPVSGAVTGYAVQVSDGHTFNFSTNITSFTDDVSSDAPYDFANYGPTIGITFQVQAQYGTQGNSAWSDPVPLELNSLSASIISGPQGMAYLVVSAMPPNTAAIRLTRDDYYAEIYNELFDANNIPNNTNFDIPVIYFTNGICILANTITPPDVQDYSFYLWFGQAVGTNGSGLSAATLLSYGWTSPADDNQNSWFVLPYFDGREQLKQNLIFQLRAATMDDVFHFSDTDGTAGSPHSHYPLTYVYSGFYSFSAYHTSGGIVSLTINDVFQPFEDNYLFRNFVFDSSELDSRGHTTTGVMGNYFQEYFHNGSYHYIPDNLILIYPPLYSFSAPTVNGAAISPLLATNQTRWLSTYPLDSAHYWLPEIGVTNDQSYSPQIYAMLGTVSNYFGLHFLSAAVGYGSGAAITLNANGNTTQDGYFYPETVQPQLQLVEYDCWPDPNTYSDGLTNGTDYPGMDGLSLNHINPVFITSVGNPYFRFSCYAKLALQNGYSGAYGLLQQYFDKVYAKDANGITTTNTTGILSPYGDFFATQPGPAALVTMPDVDTGARGTCTVYCVSLQLDKNHDGNMDLSFSGPDATSQASPMVWWVNNDNDFSIDSNDSGKDREFASPDYFSDSIKSQRDLEDYARLWICGVPALTNASYQVTLSWANISSGTPTIKLFNSVETNGGIGYLTNTSVAASQSAYWTSYSLPGWTIGTVSPSQPFTFPASYFTNSANKYFLFEGACTNGGGELLLTISQNGNTIAQTGVWLDFHNVRDFYERAVITNNMSGVISDWSSAIEMVQPATASALGDDKDLIVLVHGINVRPWDCLQQGDTVFKRLYWAGFKGKFVTVKWPCNLLIPIPQPLNLDCFNLSELQAYKASTALTNYLAQLRARFPGYRLHLLAHSQGNAIVSEAIKRGGVSFDTYILTQGALPDSAYDVDAPINADIASHDQGSNITPEWQPMGYHGIYTNFTGRIVNFYNPLDKVLGYWVDDQKLLKPSVYFDTSHYYYDGTYSYFDAVLGADYLVTDPEESRAMVSRSRTLPIGQSGPELTHGVIQSAVDLNAKFGFNGTTTDEHSAQWTRPIQTSRPYYLQILNSIAP